MTIEAEYKPQPDTTLRSETSNVTIMRYVTGELSDGRTGGVLIDKTSIPEGNEPFCFAQEFPATVLPEQHTLFERSREIVKNWLLARNVPRWRAIPSSQRNPSMLQ